MPPAINISESSCLNLAYPPRRIARNDAEQTPDEKVWYQQIVDQTLDSSLMKRYASLDEAVLRMPANTPMAVCAEGSPAAVVLVTWRVYWAMQSISAVEVPLSMAVM